MAQGVVMILENPGGAGPLAAGTTSCGGEAPLVVQCTGGTLTVDPSVRLIISPGVEFQGKIIAKATGPTGSFTFECVFLTAFTFSCSDSTTGTIFIGDPVTLTGEAKTGTTLGSAVPPTGLWQVHMAT